MPDTTFGDFDPDEFDDRPYGEFTLVGRRVLTDEDTGAVTGVEREAETFTLLPRGAKVSHRTLERITQTRAGDLSGMVDGIARVLDTDEARKRFRTMIEDPDITIEADVLAEVLNYVVGRFGNRPTRRSRR